MAQHKSLAISLLLFFVATICQMPSMIKSGFISSFGTEVLLSFVILSVIIFVVYRIFHVNSAVYTVSFMASLLFGNFAQLMLYFTCNMDTERTLKSVTDFMIYTLASFGGALVIVAVIDKIKKYKILCLGLFIAVSLAFLGLILFFGGENNTSSISNGFQPAILMMFVMLYAFSGAIAVNIKWYLRVTYIVFFWVMMGVLVATHETGIPVMTLGTCIIMYFMFNKSDKEKWFILLNIIVPVGGFVILMAIKEDLRNDIIAKFQERTEINNEHWLMAKANIQASALFGSSTYDVCVAEASTDYSLNTAIHYWGYFFGIFVFILFFFMTISSYNDILNISNDNIVSNMRKLAFCAVTVVFVYNILDNLCGAPIIGVQMLCFGTSRSMAILSGLLMGTITADTKKLKKSIISFLEKAGIITSA